MRLSPVREALENYLDWYLKESLPVCLAASFLTSF